MQSFSYEYTDTFGGEANYSWVRRGTVQARDLNHAARLARKELGLNGVRGRSVECSDMLDWRPRGCCTVLFVTWAQE
jgi:hypothetical protein